MDSLISTEALATRLDDDDLVVLDATVFLHMTDNGYRSESGRAQFDEGHIPGARFADLNEDLVDTSSPLRYVLGRPEDFAAAVERLGVCDGRQVVLYDGNQSMWATRVWWMLRWIGFDDAAVLDGGLVAWKAEGRPLESGPSPAPERVGATPGSLTVEARPHLVADRHEVASIVESGGACLIDALPGAVYRGEVQPYARPGHIPTALNVPATSMIDRDTGRFRPEPEIRELVTGRLGAGILDRPEARTVIY